ncbi:DUF3500 domain-containing protein [Dyadobacter sp. Leaf189]|uniref:DUF3500 domain-containing protein n=1 Tax=Dyadobacter sp. Leaf189 TaxID=1736295 RepID=UPI000A9D3018|nr:DUF3500 domain-containing protein [Dyadobacter sp. Leaf189]
MRDLGIRITVIAFLLFGLLPGWQAADLTAKPVQDEKLARQMAAAVNTFLKTLDDTQRKEAQLDYQDPARFDWNFTPRARKGLSLKQMNAAQRKAAMSLIRVVLSQEGYSKAEQIIDLENVLRVVETRPANDTYRDPENYAFLVFGTPGSDPWGWRVEGHHLSLHFSSIKNQITYTPSFMGSNPGKVLADVPQKGKVILKDEQEIAFRLLHSLTEAQQKKADLGGKAPNEIFTSNSRKAVLDKMEGVAMEELNGEQKALFKNLIMAYLLRYHITLKNQQWAQLEKAGLEKIHFAWMGDHEPVIGQGHGHYYRIHGPTFLIEFDNTQNGGNHIHSVVRDLTNDFGEDMLRAHYESQHR